MTRSSSRSSSRSSLSRRVAATALGLTLVFTLIPASPAAAVAPAVVRSDTLTLQFGAVTIGTDSSDQVVTLRNEGPGAATGLSLASAITTYDGKPTRFRRTGTSCGTSIAAGGFCTVTFDYAPTALLEEEGFFTYFTSGGSKGQVQMFGHATGPNTSFRVTPTSFDFGRVAVGSSSPDQLVTITNRAVGTKTFTFTGRNPSASFSSPSTTCSGSPVSLATGASCTIAYRFSPTSSGDKTGSAPLTINETGVGTVPFPVALMGHGGVGTGTTAFRVTPRTLDFGRVGVGTESTAQAITVTNVSGASRSIQMGGGGANYYGSGAVGSPCSSGLVLAAGASCQFAYIAEPETVGPRSVTAIRGIETAGYPIQRVELRLSTNGTGSAPAPTLSPAQIQLGSAPLGSTTGSRTVTVRNQGNASMTGMTLSRSPAADTTMEITTNTCGATLGAGASCIITLRYRPTSATARPFVRFTMESNGEQIDVGVQAGPHRPVWFAFLQTAFLDFQGVVRSEAELAPDREQLEAGTLTQRQVIIELANSDEWVTAIVQRLYIDTLGREGDSGGVRFWVNQIQSGRRSVARVAGAFYASNEYYEGIGGGNDTTWVRDLYVKLLGRTADSGGLAYWVGQTETRGRDSVAYRMYQSPESRRTRVTRLYVKLLGREPDTGGRNFWAGRIETEGDIALAIELASSAEYVRRATLIDGNFG